MSLPLSGQLGSAQLGAAALGQLATSQVVAGFFPLVLGGGVEPPKEKKKKKPKKLKPKKPPKIKRPKRVKVKASFIRPTEQSKPDVPPNLTPVAPLEVPPDTVIGTEPFNTAEYLKLQADVYRQARLRETIAEEDELLLLLTC